MKKNLLFTFDYELFLGANSGSVQKCMLEPTEKLISLFQEKNIKHAIFFVDTTYLIRLNEAAQTSISAANDFAAIKAQLQDLIRKEHYIFPHIHPHWLDAVYHPEKNRWSLDNIRYYRFNAISESLRASLFEQSMQLLQTIALPVNPSYRCDAYRAGGWCIQPFEDFYPHFKKHGIQTDFSVLPGLKNLSTAQYYDFEKAPQQAIYQFEDDVLQQKNSGTFTQMAISVQAIPNLLQLANKFWLKFLWKTGNHSIGDGNGVVAKASQDASPQITQLEMVSIELMTRVKMPLYLSFLQKNNYMHFISHPKMLSPHNFACFDKFLRQALDKYELETDFRKILQEV